MLRIFGCSVGVSVCAGYVGYVTPLHQCYSALMIGLSVFRQHKSVLRRLCGADHSSASEAHWYFLYCFRLMG